MKREYRSLGGPGEGVEKLLGDLERDVMEIMWDRGEGAVRDVLPALNERRPPDRQLAYTTVMTVMARLVEKGLLRRTKLGKAHEYLVAQTREHFVARASEDIARHLVEDFGEAAIAGFLTVLESVPPDRLAKLRRRVRKHGEA